MIFKMISKTVLKSNFINSRVFYISYKIKNNKILKFTEKSCVYVVFWKNRVFVRCNLDDPRHKNTKFDYLLIDLVKCFQKTYNMIYVNKI